MKTIEDLKAAYAAATPEQHVYMESVNYGEPRWRVDSERPTGEDEVIAFFENEDEAALHCLMHNTLPALIECAEALDAVMGVIKGSGADEEVLTSNFGKRYARKVLRARAALAKLETPPCATS